MTTALTPYARSFVAQKAFSLLGSEFRILKPEGGLLFYVKQKAFKLKEDIVVFSDEGQTQPMLQIKARSIMDFSATYDVTDVSTGEVIGSAKRMGWKSGLRDTWNLLSPSEEVIGQIQEDSMLFALLRRFLSNLIPQTFDVTIGGNKVGQVKQRFNPFRLGYDVDFSGDSQGQLDPRMGVALTVLLLAIEGRQKG